MHPIWRCFSQRISSIQCHPMRDLPAVGNVHAAFSIVTCPIWWSSPCPFRVHLPTPPSRDTTPLAGTRVEVNYVEGGWFRGTVRWVDVGKQEFSVAVGDGGGDSDPTFEYFSFEALDTQDDVRLLQATTGANPYPSPLCVVPRFLACPAAWTDSFCVPATDEAARQRRFVCEGVFYLLGSCLRSRVLIRVVARLCRCRAPSYSEFSPMDRRATIPNPGCGDFSCEEPDGLLGRTLLQQQRQRHVRLLQPCGVPRETWRRISRQVLAFLTRQ